MKFTQRAITISMKINNGIEDDKLKLETLSLFVKNIKGFCYHDLWEI